MLMMFDQFVSVLDGTTDGDLTRQKLKNDAISQILATDAWLKNKFISGMSPEVFTFIFGAHVSQAELTLRDMVLTFEEKLLPMTLSRWLNLLDLLYQPIKDGESIELFCLNVRRMFILLTRQAKFPGPSEPLLCGFLCRQLQPFILGEFSMDFREYQDNVLGGDFHEMTLDSFIKCVHEYNARRGIDAKANVDGQPIGISAVTSKIGKITPGAESDARKGIVCSFCSKSDPTKPVLHYFDLEFCRHHPRMKDQIAGKSLAEAKSICAAAWKAHKKTLQKKA